jgi:rhodanese-related sulfurtransferase
MKSITVENLKERIESRQPLYLLDVRAPGEVAMGALDGSVNIPMNQVERRSRELPKDRDIVVICHSGARSAHITKRLNALGFEKAVNLTGGIAAWSRRIDSNVASGGISLSDMWKSLFGAKR